MPSAGLNSLVFLSVWMAGVTGIAFPDITADVFMLVRHFALAMVMAMGARKSSVIARHGVAIDAIKVFVVAAIDREIVVKVRSLPLPSAVANLAQDRETGGVVIGVGGLVVFIQMAIHAAVGDAVVIKNSTIPGIGAVVAILAFGGISFGNVIRVRGLVEIVQVTIHATRRNPAMVKVGWQPSLGTVAILTGLGVTFQRMIGVGSGVVFRQVAIHARR